MASKDKQFVKLLISWFEAHKRTFSWRNPELTPYQVLVAEILLQKTNANQVEKVFPDFIKQFPNVENLNEINENNLAKLLEPLGLFNRRARDLKKTAVAICEKNGKIPDDRKSLMKLPGVGEYISNAVLCFGFNKPVPIIDANVGRVIKRVYSFPVKSAPSRDKDLLIKMEEIIPDTRFKEFNLGILDLGALICVPRNPKCKECPLIKICDFS